MRDEARGLVSRSLLQGFAEGYRLHDLLLDFVRDRISSTSLRKAITLQTRFLGRLSVVVACMAPGYTSEWSLYSFIALWAALEQLSEDGELCIRTYNDRLLELEAKEASEEGRLSVQCVGNLFEAKVGAPVRGMDNTDKWSLATRAGRDWTDINNTTERLMKAVRVLRPVSVQGRLDAAEPKLRNNLSMSRHLYASSDVRTLNAMGELAGLLREKVSMYCIRITLRVTYE